MPGISVRLLRLIMSELVRFVPFLDSSIAPDTGQ
jgi:hypothetical protein